MGRLNDLKKARRPANRHICYMLSGKKQKGNANEATIHFTGTAFHPGRFFSDGVMIRVRRFLFFCISLLPLAARGQVPQDTVTGSNLREVQIIGQHSADHTIGTRKTTLDSAFLQLNTGSTLAEVLQTRTPIYIKTYGNGMLSTVSFRGTSASQTAVLWHGFNINLPTLGQTDFSLIPLSSLGSVEIQHGSGGSNFGTSAIGGAILLTAKTPGQPGWQLQAQQDAGSFGYTFSQAAASYTTHKASVEASLFHRQAQNNFRFKNTTQFGEPYQRQENAALHQWGFTTNVHLQVNARNTLAIRNWYTSSDNQSQPNMVAANTHARLSHQNWRLMSEWNHSSSLGNTAVRVAYFDDFMHYQDDNNNSDTKVKTYQAQAEHRFILANRVNVDAGGDIQYFTADVDGYGKAVSETRNSAFLLVRYDPKPFLHLNVNVRQALVQGFNPPLAPTAGFTLDLRQQPNYTLSWKGAVARGYRVPTLNDRYWPTGNPTLKPENSFNYETGFTYKQTRNRLTAETELTAYWMRVDNWIQWLPSASTGAWSPQNLKRVHASGLEYATKLHYQIRNGKLTGGINYSYTSSRQAQTYAASSEPIGKQLIYVPYHTGTAFLDVNYKTWLLSTNYQYTGQRFTTAENDRLLPAFGLISLYGGKKIPVGKTTFQLIGRVNNLTNKVYQNLEYYAMPGRNYTLSLRFTLL